MKMPSPLANAADVRGFTGAEDSNVDHAAFPSGDSKPEPGRTYGKAASLSGSGSFRQQPKEPPTDGFGADCEGSAVQSPILFVSRLKTMWPSIRHIEPASSVSLPAPLQGAASIAWGMLCFSTGSFMPDGFRRLPIFYCPNVFLSSCARAYALQRGMRA